jgi:hypothetical protein
VQELERVIGRLEADKAGLGRQVEHLSSELETRDSHIQSLDSRLSQRNSQIVDLQEDVARRCDATAELEKEVGLGFLPVTVCYNFAMKAHMKKKETKNNIVTLSQSQWLYGRASVLMCKRFKV